MPMIFSKTQFKVAIIIYYALIKGINTIESLEKLY